MSLDSAHDDNHPMTQVFLKRPVLQAMISAVVRHRAARPDLPSLLEVPGAAMQIDVDKRRSWVEAGLAIIGRDVGTDTPTVADSNVYADTCLSDARSLLHSRWRAHAFLVDDLARHVVWMDHHSCSSSFVPQTLGAVYINSNLRNDPVALVEALVHETSHAELHLREHFSRYFEASDQLIASPLRSIERPSMMALHAEFVAVRLYLLATALDASGQPGWMPRRRHWRRIATDGLGGFADAVPTPEGAQLLRNLREGLGCED
jgi:HEXXH motif-containing protein